MNIYSYSRVRGFIIISFLIILSFGISLNAQTLISLEEAIERSKENNYSIQLANQAIAIQRAKHEQTKGLTKPYLGVQVTDMISNNPLNVFGFKLQQEQVVQSDFVPVTLNDPDVRNFFNVSVNAMMPIINFQSKATQEAAEHQISMKQSMAARSMQGIELEVKKTYFMLILANEAVNVLTESYNAVQANFEIAKNFYEQGLMLKSDYLDMQLMLNQTEMALNSGRKDLSNVQAQFSYLIEGNELVEYLPSEDLGMEKVISDFQLNEDRSDFVAMKNGVEAMGKLKKASDKMILPKLDLFGSFSLNDEIPFENNANNFQLGLKLSWDIYQGNSRKSTSRKVQAEMLEKELELDKIKSEARLQIVHTQRNIELLEEQISMHSLSIDQAEESLRIRKNRFEQGLEKSSDLINAEAQLSQKKLSKLQSQFEWNVQYAYLEFLLK
jgi:outer membrane protein TolC